MRIATKKMFIVLVLLVLRHVTVDWIQKCSSGGHTLISMAIESDFAANIEPNASSSARNVRSHEHQRVSVSPVDRTEQQLHARQFDRRLAQQRRRPEWMLQHKRKYQ